MYEYDVTVTKVGVIRVKAGSMTEAMELAEKEPESKVAWCDGFSATDAEEHDPYGTGG